MVKKPVCTINGGAGGEKGAAVREHLVSWFRENGRDLPWRRTRDPWRVLVSEVMLQQIQVKRAIPFYERFLDRFPTVDSLAEAPLADAIRVWGDLGRYRRVVNLHRTARLVTEEHGGEIPADPAVLVGLPGVGPYTAGAVACFAFERSVPFFDTNMHRVLHRLFFGPDVPAATAGPKEIMELAAGLVPPDDGWTWNQAVMEFGALRCTARKPSCPDCPLREMCAAHPEMLEAIAGVPRGAKKRPSARYEDSNLYLRGRVLAVLREDADDGGVTLADLGQTLLEDPSDVGTRRMLEVIQTLEKDGLARILPADETPTVGGSQPAEAVAEERAAYGAESQPATGEISGIRVTLP